MRTAFVIPWFGRDLVGGAEQHIYEVVKRLLARGHDVEVLTTTCRSFQDDWQRNHHPEGVQEESGITVRRFAVRRRNAAAFDAANRELLEKNENPKPLGVLPVSESAARTFVEENIHSPALLSFLATHGRDYQSVVFAPYLYGPILHGVALVRERAFLQPLLHDETYAYLPAVEAIFQEARRIFFISEGEALLAARLFGPSMWRKGMVLGGGGGIDLAAPIPSADYDLPSSVAACSYLLYLGRRDPTKNTDFLLRAFQRYRASNPQARLQLVIAGPGEANWPEAREGGVVDLGLVSPEGKTRLLDGCRALVQPSRNESYSRTMMEAWLHGRPVIVHGDCIATSRAVEVSRGGWLASTEEEWSNAFTRVDGSSEAELSGRGQLGMAYARVHADWNRVIKRYEDALELGTSSRRRRAPRKLSRRAVHQMLPSIDYGDAISNQVVFTREALRELGYESEIFAWHIADSMRDVSHRFESGAFSPDDALLYHHAIGSEITPHAVAHRGPKALIYHNITPARFFEDWDPAFARFLEEGRKDLHDMASVFPVSAGDSRYNADELRDAGFPDPSVVPIFVEPMRWSASADAEWMKILQDGRTNVLFVGRVAPNKCHHHLLEAFSAYRQFDPRARLIIAGGWVEGHPYARFVRSEAERLGISQQVVLTWRLTDAQLLACYRTANLYWSMSEHEGFCVPLVEAMWFDIPVLAYRSSAVPETLGSAGAMFTEKGRWPELAAFAHLLVEDRDLRRKVLEAQRRRRSTFLPEAVLPSLLQLLARLGVGDEVEADQDGRTDVSSQYPSMIRGQR